MLSLEPRLQAVLEGKDKPAHATECLDFAELCQFSKKYVAAAGLYANAFAADPNLANVLAAGHRYHAARAAAQAGCGHSPDSAKLTEPERKRWREQARQWLRADLTALETLLDDGLINAREGVQGSLVTWRSDPALSCLREKTELEEFSADERKDCLALWHEVGIVLARARSDR
jgi:serine/threonine-protein kinase